MSMLEPTSKKHGRKARSTNGVAHAPAPPVLDPRHVLSALRAFKRGDFTVRMREDLTGIDGQIAGTFN
jgi:hypothetical protein